jgi:pimeloyl-ACP methyl ester carboxylesterase
VADDSRSQSQTDDLPDAVSAFRAERAERREKDAFGVSRAGALLSLVRPRQIAANEFRLVTVEARELLGVEPIEPFELGREELATELDGLGVAGERASRLLRHELNGRRITDQPSEGSTGAASSGRITRDLRELSEPERETVDAVQREAATQLFASDGAERRSPGRDPAGKLIAASLLDEDPLVQVAAAAAALRVDKKNPVAEAILDEATRDSDEIAELSRAILTSDRQTETRAIEIEYPPGEPDPAADSTLIHGTWARWGRWWQPDGKLYRYLRDEESLFPHLYQGPDPFKWSGYFNFRVEPKRTKDWNRQQAADSLAWWAHRRLKSDPDLIGHSYGGSLSMMATRAEKRVRGMVLLSPAVHRTCLPDPANYERVLHVTTKLDLVLLADLSTPSLLRSLPNVVERRIKRRGLMGHGATHDPRVWRESDLAEYVRDIWLPSLTPRA